MTENSSQVPWTDEQWDRVKQVIQEEASRSTRGGDLLAFVRATPPRLGLRESETMNSQSDNRDDN